MEKVRKVFSMVFIFASIVYAQSETVQKKELLTQKQNQLIAVENKISEAQIENSKAAENVTAIEKRQKEMQFNFENKKNAFERASKNVDIISAEKLNQLSADFKQADQELREANAELQKAKLRQQEASKSVDQYRAEKKQLEQDIAEIKADIFDIELREPVWAIGEAVCNLSENETPDQCRKRALEAAQKDAMEKGGKMILESETIVSTLKVNFVQKKQRFFRTQTGCE